MRRLASHILLVLMMMALAGQAGASVSADYVTAGGAALRLKKTGTGAFVPEYTHFDSQGSAVAATNSAGTVTWRERYAPFGEELLNPAANDNNTGFTGHLEDDASGLVYMQARYYDPLVPRFLSTDPIGYQDQLNLNAYVANDPVNFWDPNGEESACFGTGGCSSFEAMAADPPNLGVPLAAGAALLPGPEDVVLAAAGAVKGAMAAVKAGDAIADGAKAAAKTCCFVAGTLVETADGLKPIETIEIGDLVLARDVETGETALKAVTDLIRRHERVIWEVSLTGPDSETARFETTDDHPWWIAGEGWKTTEDLRPGMAVVTKDSRGMVVAAVKETARTDATYNLTIADFETYFVGEAGVLVHNCPGSSGGPGAGKPFSESTKNAAESKAGGKCVYCDRSTSRETGGTQRNTDHADPKSQGGNNTLNNAQNTCRTCNLQKGARTDGQFKKDLAKGEKLKAKDEE